MWRPSLEYPLAVTGFTKSQSHNLQKAFTSSFLSKIGIARTTARTIVFGPLEAWVQQGISDLRYLLGRLNVQDKVGNLIKINLDLLYLHIGFPDPPLTFDYSNISSYIEPSWLSTCWEFLSDVAGIIRYSDPWILPLDRRGNCFLMPQALCLTAQYPKPFPKSDLIRFNRGCRLYLQVLTLSDIKDSGGTKIAQTFWNGHQSSRTSTLIWPCQARPAAALCTVWRRFLNTLFTTHKRKTDLLPSKRLYEWLPSLPSHQNWPSYLDPNTSNIYCRVSTCEDLFSVYNTHRQMTLNMSQPLTTTLPESCIPIQVFQWSPLISKSSYKPRTNTPLTHLSSLHPASFSECIGTLPSHEQYFLQLKYQPDHPCFLQDIHNNKFTIATSGSVRTPHDGSFAWIIHGTRSKMQLVGSNTTSATATDLSTLRVEACGILGSIYAVRSLLQYCPPPTTNQILVVAYIDNTGVIKALSGPIMASVHQTHTPDTDLF